MNTPNTDRQGQEFLRDLIRWMELKLEEHKIESDQASSDPEPERKSDIEPILWLGTRRQLVYLLYKLAEKRPKATKGLISDEHVWKQAATHFCKADGSKFDPKGLACDVTEFFDNV